ncbi:MAG: N-acetylmuramoyl-L-alanine amidase [Lactobacillaceae bacterium]|jgi:N-acetylmuramoyl-L-alanine amidase|nr:N-acetylmuramoyl-L-alanine amidase [Lactobacillaceae bacterium]
MKKHPLPYVSRRKMPVYMLVLHCSAQDTIGMIEVMHQYKVSSHYIVGYNGEITQTADDYDSAHHAGKSFWRGHEDLNQCSIGIEISNPTLGQTEYTKEQIDTLIKFLPELIAKYDIKQRNIIGHSDIAPTRKPDPGIAFPWKLLSEHGVGVWYDINDAGKMAEKDVAKLLNIIGYDTRTEESVLASCYAFRRRFLPDEVKIDNDIAHLVNNVYPVGDKSLKEGKKFLNALKAVAYKYLNM